MSLPKGYKHSMQAREKMSRARKGRPLSLEHRLHKSQAQIGLKNHRWKGGLKKHSSGYLLEKCPNHPNADQKGYVPQHRLRMEAHIGRVLLPTEVVHHVNGIRNDNRIENLMLFPGRGTHTNYHKNMTHESTG